MMGISSERLIELFNESFKLLKENGYVEESLIGEFQLDELVIKSFSLLIEDGYNEKEIIKQFELSKKEKSLLIDII